jgi:hypothetical protein
MYFIMNKKSIAAFLFVAFVWSAAGIPAAMAQQQGDCSKPSPDGRPSCQAELNIQRGFAEWLAETMPAIMMDQSNADFSGQQLTQVDFTSVTLRNTRFNNAQLDWANFTGADLTGASFVGADLTSATFSNANLTNADFTGANMARTRIDGADLTGARLSRVQNIATINMSETTILCRTIGYNDEVFSYTCPE